ncbi:MAG: rhodanese-like domain-containing protein [bacterium]|nr:rhodanese-like domain-containing protein [bacterium]
MEDLQLSNHAGRFLNRLLGTALGAALILLACSDSPADRNISVETLRDLAQADTALYLLDVRAAAEYERVHLSFTSSRIPLDSLEYALDLLPKDRDVSIYCLCAVGQRSSRAAAYLSSVGYKNACNIDGGLKAWVDAGFEVTKD